MRQNQLRAILIFLITLTTTWQFAAYRYTDSVKKLEQKVIFQLGTLYSHGINERLSFHLFIHKSMWQGAPDVTLFSPMVKLPHTLIKINSSHNSCQLSKSSNFFNSFDKTNFSHFTLPPTQPYNFFRNSKNVQSSTSWAIRPTGSLSLCGSIIIP